MVPKVKDPIRGLLLFLLFFSASFQGYGQVRIEGKVLDEGKGKGVPFAHIVPLGSETQGTQSDLNGNFVLEVPERPSHLVISNVGYRKDTVKVPEGGEEMRIELKKKAVQTRTVEVRPGPNPAIPIMRKVISRRKKHDPLEEEAFSYRSYSKLIYSDRSLSFDTTWSEYEGASTDSSMERGLPDSLHAFLMETVTERNYAKGSHDKKTVQGARASGFKEAPFAAIASEFQEISFYGNYVSFLGKKYRSPIGKGALGKYEYELRNTLISGEDSTFFIAFSPKPAKEVQALEGLLVVRSGSYALESVRAFPSSQGKNPVRVEQRYKEHQDAWFPTEMNFEARIPAYGTVINGRSYLREIEVGPDAGTISGRKDLTIEKDEGFGDRDSLFWEKNRSEPLSRKDSVTYQLLDSLGQEVKLDRVAKTAERIGQGRLPIGPFDLRLYELYRYNAFEKNRLGIGAETNEELSAYFRIGGYWGYGTGDKRVKYGFDLDIRPKGNKEWRFGPYYRNEVREPGQPFNERETRYFGENRILSQKAQERLFMRRALHGEEMGFRFRTGRPRYLRLGFSARSSEEELLYSTPYLEAHPEERKLEIAETAFRLRFAYGERAILSGGKKLALETPYPVLQFRMVKGWKRGGLFPGERSYLNLFARVEHDYQLRGLGRGRITLEGGSGHGDVPLSRRFYAPGTFSRDIPLLISRSFNTADRYEFLHSRFLHGFLQQDLFRFTIHEKYSRPLVRMRHHVGWGDQEGFGSERESLPLKMEEGYFESGLTVRDLIRVDYDLYYLGLGVSSSYRYGPYHRPGKELKNIAYGMELSVSF